MENCYKNIFIFLQICDTMSWWKKERGEKIEKEFGNGCIFYANRTEKQMYSFMQIERRKRCLKEK